VQADFGQARRLAEEMLKLAQAENEAALLASAYFHLGTVEMQSGNFVEGSLYFEQTITLHDFRRRHPATAHIRPDYGVMAHCFASTSLWHLGYPEKALSHSGQACALADGFARPYDQVVALTYTAMLHHFCGQIDLVEKVAQRATALAQEHAFAYYLSWATILLGWVEVERGEAESGIAAIRTGLAAFDKTGAAIRKPYYLGLLAEALNRAGELQQALVLVDEALALISASGERWSEAELYRQRGELLLAQGVPFAEVEPVFAQALEIARRQQAKSLQLRTIMSLCRMWRQQGKGEAARQALAEILGWFTEGFDTPELMQAQSLLRGLPS
jgi:predicted ATPase